MDPETMGKGLFWGTAATGALGLLYNLITKGLSPKPEKQKSAGAKDTLPPKYLRESHKLLASNLENLIRKGAGGGYYKGPRVAPLTPATQQAAYGLGLPMMNYMDPYWRRQLLSPTSSAVNLRDIAAGYGARNPYLEDAIRATQQSVEDSVSRAMAGAGRFGSVAHSQALARAISPYALSARAQQYNQDIQNRMAANKLIDASRWAQIDAANKFYQGQGTAAQQALMGGNVFDRYNQALINAHMKTWEDQQLQDLRQQERMQNLFAGLTKNFSTETTRGYTEKTPAYDPGAQMLGMAGAVMGNYGDIYQGLTGKKLGG